MGRRYGGKYHPEPTNSDDVIDSRDVIARIEELQEERQTLIDAVEEAEVELGEVVDKADPEGLDRVDIEEAQDAVKDAKNALVEWTGNLDDVTDQEVIEPSEGARELAALESLQEDCEGCSDWTCGATLIRDTYFKDYAVEFASDIGAINRDTSWPNTCIDWDQAASELMQDYTSVDFDGVGYQIR